MKGTEKSGNSSRTNPTMINVTRTPRPIVRPPTSQARHVTNNNNPNQNVVANAPSRANGLPPTAPTSTLHREQDQYMPLTNLVRVMRRALPPHAKVAEGAKETVQECVSEFISFVTVEANNKCHQEQRKTVTADDLIWAMGRLGFDNYVGPLSLYLQKYREMEGTDRARPSKNVGLVRGRSEYNYGFQGAGPWASNGLMPGPTTTPPIPMNPTHGLMDYHNDGSGSSSGSNMGFGYVVAEPNEPSPIISPNPNINYNFGPGNNENPGHGKSTSSAASSSEDDLGSFDPEIFFN